jgi:uncharacterized protein (TIGR00255 family)
VRYDRAQIGEQGGDGAARFTEQGRVTGMKEGRSRIRSMTAFGRGAAEEDGLRLEVEIRGVNHRFLDVKLRLPAEVQHLETDLRARLKDRVARGRIDVIATLLAGRRPAPRVSIQADLAGEYVAAARSLKRRFRLAGGIALDRLLAMPGVVQVETAEPPPDDRAAALMGRAFEEALAGYEAASLAEGGILETELRGRLAEIESETGRIETEGESLPERRAARLRERLAGLAARDLDPVRLAQEVALLATRVDITEEIVRLKGYLIQARAALQGAGGSVGKTLDFIMQEMNREATTIASKAEALAICQAALAIRAAVEKIREQVQNLE